MNPGDVLRDVRLAGEYWLILTPALSTGAIAVVRLHGHDPRGFLHAPSSFRPACVVIPREALPEAFLDVCVDGETARLEDVRVFDPDQSEGYSLVRSLDRGLLDDVLRWVVRSRQTEEIVRDVVEEFLLDGGEQTVI